MKNGIALIAKERLEQTEKHQISINNDVETNRFQQLRIAAYKLISNESYKQEAPSYWYKKTWIKMRNKPYKERLIIAGALIAAEIDRIEKENQ